LKRKHLTILAAAAFDFRINAMVSSAMSGFYFIQYFFAAAVYSFLISASVGFQK